MHVAATGEARILVADQHRLGGGAPLRILGPVDESEDVALVEGAKTVDLIHDLGETTQAIGQPLGQLEAHVEPMGPDVEQQVAWRRHRGVARTGELAERMQPGRAGTHSEPIPQGRTDPASRT